MSSQPTQLHATDSVFLRTNAKALILPMTTDGVILNRVTERVCLTYPSNRIAYQALCRHGQPALGDVLMHTVEHQTTGLAVGNNKSADYLFNLMVAHHAQHNAQKSTMMSALTNLKPQLFELMRYRGLRHVALYATPLLSDELPITWLWQALSRLNIPRLRMDVHLSKTDLALLFTPNTTTQSTTTQPINQTIDLSLSKD